MTTYKYQAISKNGEKVNGVIEAIDEFDAVSRIKQSCDVVIKIRAIKEEKEGILNKEIGGNRLNIKAFTVMCSQFSIILKAGVPIARTVHLIAERTTDKPIKKMLIAVAEDVEAGRGVADSFMERGKKLLPVIFIETIRAGEESGNLDRAFESMHKHYEKQLKVKGKVKNALVYPTFVLVIALVVVIVLMVKVVPTFITIFDGFDADLPLITRILIAISNFFRDYILLLLAFTAIVILAIKLYNNTESGRLKLARLALQLPVFGNIIQLNAASQFSNTMATMLDAGISLTKSIKITAQVIDNYHISQEIGKMVARLEEGYALGSSMRETACLPDILIDMVEVGEESGELERTLDTISDYYDNELDVTTTNVLNKLEPTVLVGVAAIAGFIVLAVYIAMFQMYSLM